MSSESVDIPAGRRFRPGSITPAVDGHRFATCANCRNDGRLYTGVGPNTGDTSVMAWVHTATDKPECGR